jgi:hypothetical protein
MESSLRSRAAIAAFIAAFAAVHAIAGTPAVGTVYIGAAYGTHNVYRVDFDYDGVGTMTTNTTTLVTLPSAADAFVIPGGNLIVAGQGTPVYEVDVIHGTFQTRSTSNNGNTIALDPSDQSVWIGWDDTSPSQVPIDPFGDGTVHALHGDDTTITVFAFTPSNGVFYANGSETGFGNVGTVDMSSFATTRLVGNVPATTIFYDRYSRSLIYAGFGKATQVDPSDPTTTLSSRDDSAAGENYLSLRPDGRGHLFGTRWGGNGGNPTGGRLVLVDYSATGLIGDPSTIIASAPTFDGLSGGAAVDTSILFNGFETPVR